MGVSALRAPGFWEWDQAITREFPLREKMRLEFRAEAFNVTNSVRLGAPNTTVSGTYGQITSDQAYHRRRHRYQRGQRRQNSPVRHEVRILSAGDSNRDIPGRIVPARLV